MDLSIAPPGYAPTSSRESPQQRLDRLCADYERAKTAEDHAAASKLAGSIALVLERDDDERALSWWTASRAHTRIARLCFTCLEPALVFCGRCGDYACSGHVDGVTCLSCGRPWIGEATAS